MLYSDLGKGWRRGRLRVMIESQGSIHFSRPLLDITRFQASSTVRAAMISQEMRLKYNMTESRRRCSKHSRVSGQREKTWSSDQ